MKSLKMVIMEFLLFFALFLGFQSYAIAAGITVTPTSGLTTIEAGGAGHTATFTIVLTSAPTASVTIGLSSSDITEGTVSPASITFTSSNWNVAQTVTVTGVDDSIADGNVAYTIITAAAVSGDANYSGLNPDNVSVTNTDNDTAGITVTPTSGLATTEAGGTATFIVVLNSQPTANVTIELSSSDTTEGTVSSAGLIFGPVANPMAIPPIYLWNIPQTVTVNGVDDTLTDGPVAYTIITEPTLSADAAYNGFNPANVSITNSDNEIAGITVTPTSGRVTTEAGGTATFTIVLDRAPTSNVTIALTSSDNTEGTVSPASLTFTPVIWNLAQTVAITGVDDNIDDDNIAYTIITAQAASTDVDYNGRIVADVTVTNIDNDTAGITVTPTVGLTTTETSGVDTFTVRLDTQPTSDVSIGLFSNDLTEGTVSPAGITFTSTNWNTPQIVTITGVDDNLVDGNVTYKIITAAAVSADAKYNGKDPADVTVTNIDNDTAGIMVTPPSGLTTTEAGGTATFTVVLNTQPIAFVTVTPVSSDLTEGTVSPASLIFTSANWNTAQIVTLTGVDDSIDDGNINYTITLIAGGVDAQYSALAPVNLPVTNIDDDTVGITVTPTSGLITTEGLVPGQITTFTVVLNALPAANVTIPLSSSDTTEGTVFPASITFTFFNWNIPQVITITGVDDTITDGDIAYTIITAHSVSNDPSYNGIDPANISVTNIDDETAGITVYPTSGLITTEMGGTATFMVALNRAPTANVTIGLSSNDTTEGTVLPASLTFTPANWNVPQIVTVTGVDDNLKDGNVAYTIITTPAVSADPGYNALNPVDVSVTNSNNDTVSALTCPIPDTGQTQSYTDTFGEDSDYSINPPSYTKLDALGNALSDSAESWSMVKDNVTGLMWEGKTDDGFIHDKDNTYNWDNAQSVFIANLNATNYGGFSDWRLPTIKELSSIVDSGRTDWPAINTDYFPNTMSSDYWSSTTYAYYTDNAWCVDFYVGDVYGSYKSSAHYVRAVRGGQSGSLDNLVINGDGTVTDTSTGLTWQQQTAGPLAWEEAISYCEGLSLGGYDDWRLPNRNELQSLVDYTRYYPAIDTATFPNTVSSDYWSSTTYAYYTYYAWCVKFYCGYGYGGLDGAKSSSYYVRAVRGGQSGSLDNLVIVTPKIGLTTTENGGMATFTVVLNTKPTADVTIAMSSSDTTEGTVSPASITFTSSTWNVPQIVTVTGVDDDLVDSRQFYWIITAPAVSNDPGYNGLNPADVSVINIDNDTVSALTCPIPDTGQTQSYTDTFGEDSDYTINPPSYTKLDALGNALPDLASSWSMVKDNVTGLMWEGKTDDGSIHDKDNEYNWNDAQSVFIANLNAENYGGFSDWRLPTIKELSSIVDNGTYGPTVNTDYFPNTMSSHYWSSTTNANYTYTAWCVYFSNGIVDGSSKSSSYCVRAVRGGQSGLLDNLVINGDGTVTDTSTGLTWQQQTAVPLAWEEAISYCEGLSLGGYDDWRLPNRNELQSLVDYTRYGLAIDSVTFPGSMSSYYWSSTTFASYTYAAWCVSFGSGHFSNHLKSGHEYVRAVRGGQSGALDNLVIVTLKTHIPERKLWKLCLTY